MTPQGEAPEIAARQRWLGVLARADLATMQQMLADIPALPPFTRLRGPETGLVMLRGRTGGGGAAFNLGEITVTRCTVRADGRIGHSYRTGRDGAAGELAARLDAALQDDRRRPALLEQVVDRLAAVEADRRTAWASHAAATRVDFFTMATMRG